MKQSSSARPQKNRKLSIENEFARCLCQNTFSSSTLNPLTCTVCKNYSHAECVAYLDTLEDFVCLLCRLKDFDPFNLVENTVYYSIVGNTKITTVVNFGNLKLMRSSGLEVYIFCIPIRDGRIIHEYPKTLNIVINEAPAHVVQEPTWEHKRRDNPIKITHLIKSGENALKIVSTTYENPERLFLLTISLVKPVAVNSIMEDIQANRTLPLEEATDRVIDIMTKSSLYGDEVVCMNAIRKFRLICPVTLTRIQIPTRGKHCRHLQCVDLQGYLQVTFRTNAFNMRWKCPECTLIIKPSDLVVDTYFMEVLANSPANATCVELNANGSYNFDLLSECDNSSYDSYRSSDTKREASPPNCLLIVDSD